jgi:hypothetical protein
MNNTDTWVSILCILAGVVVFGRWILQRRKYRLAASWPVELGRLESSRVVLSTSGGQPGVAAAYYAELKYSYAVQGTSYSGLARRRFIRKESAESWVQRFTTSNMLTVRYSPDAPADSVLREEDQTGLVRISG